MELYDNCCVWLSFYEMVKDFSGKTRRVRRASPKVYAGVVYTLFPIEQDDLRPFIGWTYKALRQGAPAKHYGRPLAVFRYKDEMFGFAEWLKGLLDWAMFYGQPWNGGSPIQIGWNGVRGSDSSVRSTCYLCDRLDCPYTGRPDVQACSDYRPGRGRLPKAFGNLVWAKVRGLCADRTRESTALLDLEQIERQDEHDPYVQVMHAYPRDYGNEGVYASEIVSVSDRAMRIIHKSEGTQNHL